MYATDQVYVQVEGSRLDSGRDSFRDKLCRPKKGRSLGAVVEKRRKALADAVELLANSLLENPDKFEVLRKHDRAKTATTENDAQRFGWFAINVALLKTIAFGRQPPFGILEACDWFFGPSSAPNRDVLRALDRNSVNAANSLLAAVVVDEGFRDLLPYLLEPHGHITRGQLERDGNAARARQRKREGGVYYTPSDVAEFIVSELGKQTNWSGKWLDPACGTGVFLRLALRNSLASTRETVTSDEALSHCVEKIHGMDVSVLACDSCTFVLLAECLHHGESAKSPYESWIAIRNNIATYDATLVTSGEAQVKPQVSDLIESANAHLPEIFPGIGEGFDVVVMNPPYSRMALTASHLSMWRSYRGLKAGQIGNTVLAFTEMMHRFANRRGSAAAVLPLSIGASTKGQYCEARSSLFGAGGRYEFLFFDREPHALFGEDIKTRNAIVFRWGDESNTQLSTSGLLKWTSRQRAEIFTRDRLTPLGSINGSRFIPKLSNSSETAIYESLRRIRSGTPQRKPEIGKVRWLDVAGAADGNNLFVAPTAYNFLSIFHALADSEEHPFSESAIHRLTFRTPEERNSALAVLSTPLTFWLWHVEGDGFHVTSEFLEGLPLWCAQFRPAQQVELSRLGEEIGREALESKMRSVNAGKVTYSFHCQFGHPAIASAQRLAIDVLGLPTNTADTLDAFVARTTSIDGQVRRLRRAGAA